jgi:hypothetical protein
VTNGCHLPFKVIIYICSVHLDIFDKLLLHFMFSTQDELHVEEINVPFSC